jgi:mediator of replication checkpoint protein 1
MPDRVPNTQASEVIEPSQDVGLVQHTPLKERFMDPPHSTVDTVVLDPADAQESPLVRRGRLRRKIDASIPEEELEPTAPVESTAFAAMHEAAQKEKRKAAIEEFNRKKSKAKEMVEEHAEESEDEYAGLGGYDGEESDNESIASVKEMIDDAAGNDADDRKIAAFYA